MGVLKSCQPRKDLLEGNINLSIFTASIGDVARHYLGIKTETHSIYTDAEMFFREGTYPTTGLKQVVQNVFARISGDSTAPAMQRLETAFGGGKTHTLIACMHLARQGTRLASVVGDLLEEKLLPEPGTIQVVAISGDDVPVRKTRGTELLPYGLWDELAWQIGGQELCEEVSQYLGRRDAPDTSFFDRVLGGRKVLIMIDELAQYTTRWNVAYPGARDMVGSFLMSFLGYIRNHTGIAVVMTLASSTDAFANQTLALQQMLEEVSGEEMNEDEALVAIEKATRDISTVVARDETVVVPVQGSELSAVMGKRLFSSIDRQGAENAVEEYRNLYRKNASHFPAEVQQDNYRANMLETYPFHPTLINFLNNKMATLETFQGTRGVLRVLSLAVRTLWQRQKDVPMIHSCHLDFHDARTTNEILGRTGNNGLLPVLNADIGAPDTEKLEGGLSNAQLADRTNPHPEGIPLHEFVWKAVFLHSLVGRGEAEHNNLFGLTEQEALLETSFPGLSPSQAQEALKGIEARAYYLHFRDGRYYASTQPTLNVSLSRIRGTLTEEQILTELEVLARKIVRDGSLGFKVVNDVTTPRDVPEDESRPCLGIVSPRMEQLDPEEFITRKGESAPRLKQNLVFLLIPETVQIQKDKPNDRLFNDAEDRRQRARVDLFEMARNVMAMKKLRSRPQDYGMTAQQLQEKDFSQKVAAREKDLETRLTQSYRYLVIPSVQSVFALREIRTAGGEGGQGVAQQIREVLLDEGKLFTREHLAGGGLAGLHQLFFQAGGACELQMVRDRFQSSRGWPVLESPELFDLAIREGVVHGNWCVFGRLNEETAQPEEFYSPETDGVPYNCDLTQRYYRLVTLQGAKKRGWGTQSGPTKEETAVRVREIVQTGKSLRVAALKTELKDWRDDVDDRAVVDSLVDLVRQGKAYVYEGDPDQREKPDQLISGSRAVAVAFQPDIVLISRNDVAERGWLDEIGPEDTMLKLEGREGAEILMGMLSRIAQYYSRGATTTVDLLQLAQMELPGGGRLDMVLTEATPKTLKMLGELFETLSGLVSPTRYTDGFLEIRDPQEDCPFVKAVIEARNDRKQGD